MNNTGQAHPSAPFADVPFDDILKCIHCGLCMESCPTYRELRTEQDSPRGRLYLMRGLWEGELEPDREVLEPLSRCIDCRACQTACPASVPYGQLLGKTRSVLLEHNPPNLWKRALRQLFFKHLLTRKSALLFFARLIWLYGKTGLPSLVTAPRWAGLVPAPLARLHRLLPAFSFFPFTHRPSSRTAPPVRDRVGLFSGCIMNVAETRIHRDSVRLLEAAGFEVVVPREQTCCGALHSHGGETRMARELAQKNERVFAGARVDHIVVNAAGCGAQLKEYTQWAPDDDPEGREPWSRFSAKVVDILDFLNAQPAFRPAWRNHNETVFFDAPCHLIHAQKIHQGPIRLLKTMPGVNLILLDDADSCCGAGGIFNLVHGHLAEAVLDRKLDHLERSLSRNPEATTLVTANPGCLFQLRHGVRKRRLPLRVIHPVELLAERLP